MDTLWVVQVTLAGGGTELLSVDTKEDGYEVLKEWVEYMGSKPVGSWHIRAFKTHQLQLFRFDMIAAMSVQKYKTSVSERMLELQKKAIEKMPDSGDEWKREGD